MRRDLRGTPDTDLGLSYRITALGEHEGDTMTPTAQEYREAEEKNARWASYAGTRGCVVTGENLEANARLFRHAAEQSDLVEEFWRELARGFSIEPRACFEANYRRETFSSPIALALHHVWKRKPEVADLQTQIEHLRDTIDGQWTEIEALKLGINSRDAQLAEAERTRRFTAKLWAEKESALYAQVATLTEERDSFRSRVENMKFDLNLFSAVLGVTSREDVEPAVTRLTNENAALRRTVDAVREWRAGQHADPIALRSLDAILDAPTPSAEPVKVAGGETALSSENDVFEAGP